MWFSSIVNIAIYLIVSRFSPQFFTDFKVRSPFCLTKLCQFFVFAFPIYSAALADRKYGSFLKAKLCLLDLLLRTSPQYIPIFYFNISPSTSSRIGTSIGFAICPFIPASAAAFLSSSNAFAVIAMIGIPAISGSSSPRICPVAS